MHIHRTSDSFASLDSRALHSSQSWGASRFGPAGVSPHPLYSGCNGNRLISGRDEAILAWFAGPSIGASSAAGRPSALAAAGTPNKLPGMGPPSPCHSLSCMAKSPIGHQHSISPPSNATFPYSHSPESQAALSLLSGGGHAPPRPGHQANKRPEVDVDTPHTPGHCGLRAAEYLLYATYAARGWL